MFKSKGALVGVAAALVASALLVAGMTVNTTAGAGTDTFGGAPSGLPAPTTGSAPASPIEPGTGTNPATNPVGTTNPTNPNAGAPGAGGTGPSALPSAGFGTESGNSTGIFVVLMALAGAALVGAGATAVAKRRG